MKNDHRRDFSHVVMWGGGYEDYLINHFTNLLD